MLTRRSLFSAFAVLLLTSPALSASISIPIPNGNFVSPYVPNEPPYAAPSPITDWQQSPMPAGYIGTLQDWQDSVGVFVNVSFEYIDNAGPQAAFMFATPGLEISQQLTNTFQVGTSYQLSVGIAGGSGGMATGTPMEFGLYYLNGSGNQVMVGTTTVLSTPLPAVGYINDLPNYQLTIPAVAASAPWAGQNIGVALIQTATPANEGGYWDIDNVRLVATTPSTSVSVWSTSSGNWSTVGNWVSGGVPNAAGAAAVINPPTGGNLAITLDEPVTLGALVLGNTSGTSGNCVLSGAGSNMLTLSNSGNGATITLASGSHEIEAPVVLADNLTVSGSGTLAFGQASSIADNGNGYTLTLNAPGGTLVLSGGDSYRGGTTVTAGTLIVTSDASLAAGSALTVAGGVVIFDSAEAVAGPVAAASSASTIATVPEPGTLALLALGVAAAGVACIRLKMPFVSAALAGVRFPSRTEQHEVISLQGHSS